MLAACYLVNSTKGALHSLPNRQCFRRIYLGTYDMECVSKYINTGGRVGFHNTLLQMGIEHTNNFGMDTTSACPNQAQEEALTATACVQQSFTII